MTVFARLTSGRRVLASKRLTVGRHGLRVTVRVRQATAGAASWRLTLTRARHEHAMLSGRLRLA